jgi:hypothetical protein
VIRGTTGSWADVFVSPSKNLGSLYLTSEAMSSGTAPTTSLTSRYWQAEAMTASSLGNSFRHSSLIHQDVRLGSDMGQVYVGALPSLPSIDGLEQATVGRALHQSTS